MINSSFVGNTAGAHIKEEKDGTKRLFFSVYTKINKTERQWVRCSCKGKFAETIAPWLMLPREEGSESKDKYKSRQVYIIGKLQITRETKEKKHPIANSEGEVVFEVDVPYHDTSLIVWIDSCEFLDGSGEKSEGKKLDKTTVVDDDKLDALKKLLNK